MKNKKQYSFGNSNYRKQNPEIKNKTWFHFEKGPNNALMLFVIHPDDVKSCFEHKKLKEQTGTKGKVTNVCTLKFLGQLLANSVEEFFEMERKHAANIDDYFQVTLHTDREFIGQKLPDDLWLASLAC